MIPVALGVKPGPMPGVEPRPRLGPQAGAKPRARSGEEPGPAAEQGPRTG